MSKLGGGKINLSKNRSKLDYYPTPSCAIDALLDREIFEGSILEPASGDGAISRVLEERGYSVDSFDLNDEDWIYGEGGVDFLDFNRKYDWAITNPPYSHGYEFVEHAYEIANIGFAFLLRFAFAEGVKRGELFEKCPISKIYIFSKRLPYWQDGKWHYTGGQFAHAWYIWDKRLEGEDTKIRWIK